MKYYQNPREIPPNPHEPEPLLAGACFVPFLFHSPERANHG